MTTMISPAAQPAISGPFGGWLGRLEGWLLALLNYRERREAVRMLQELDDRALRDIGIARCHIEAAVGGAMNPEMARLR